MPFSIRNRIEAHLLGQNSVEAERLLDPREFDELLSLQNRVSRQAGRARRRGRVYILPGIMGSTLYGDRRLWLDDWIWISPELAFGAVKKLKIGSEPNPIIAKNALNFIYLKLKLSLQNEGYDADYMPFDWRLSPNALGEKLFEQIKTSGERGVTLICHSMGGLLARQMASLDPNKDVIKRVITLGTPNFGSYSPVQAFALCHSTMRMLDKIDGTHSEREIVEKYVKFFPGLIEMMPDKRLRPNEDYFKFSYWPASTVKPDRGTLRSSKTAKATLPEVDDRFIQIIGMSENTLQAAQIKNGKFHFDINNDGDGTVPREFAEMGGGDRYYADQEHQKLPRDRKVIKGIADILKTGATTKLRKRPFKQGEQVSATETVSSTQLIRRNNLLPTGEIKKLLRDLFGEQLVS